MADRKALRLIGLSFGAIAAGVMMIAALLVAQTTTAAGPVPLVASASAASG